VIAVRDRLAEFGDALVVVVTFAAPERLASYREHLGVTFPIVADVERRLYALLGAERASTRQVWSLGTLRMYAQLLRRGRRLRVPTEDVTQLGADAVVSRDGRLRYLSLPATPDARPPVAELIAALD
jgi:peroxiredoxin